MGHLDATGTRVAVDAGRIGVRRLTREGSDEPGGADLICASVRVMMRGSRARECAGLSPTSETNGR